MAPKFGSHFFSWDLSCLFFDNDLLRKFRYNCLSNSGNKSEVKQQFVQGIASRRIDHGWLETCVFSPSFRENFPLGKQNCEMDGLSHMKAIERWTHKATLETSTEQPAERLNVEQVSFHTLISVFGKGYQPTKAIEAGVYNRFLGLGTPASQPGMLQFSPLCG